MGNSTSTTITFVTQTIGGAGNIAIELDDDKNNKKSQFASGDTVFFRIFTSPLAMLLESDCSAGAVAIGAEAILPVTETLVFANEKEASVRFIGEAITSFKWFGRDLGQPSLSGNLITIPAAGIGVLEVKYSAKYRAGNLSGVTIPAWLNEFPVVVVITERAAV